MSLSTTFRAASPLTFAGNSTPRSSRCEAADRMMSWVSVSLAIGILRSLVRRRLPPPPQPHLGHAAGGAGSRSAPGARNGHSTALFADECQSFLDNVMAGLGQIGAWSDPATSTPRDFVAEWSYPICASSRQRLAAGSTARMEHQTTNLGVRS